MVRELEWDEMDEGKCPWTDTELKLIEIVMQMMDLDPTYERLERVFERALRLVRALKEGK